MYRISYTWKLKPSLHIIKHHTTQTYGGRGSSVPCILNLRTRWRWVINFKLQLLYPEKNSLWYSMYAVGAGLGAVWACWSQTPVVQPIASHYTHCAILAHLAYINETFLSASCFLQWRIPKNMKLRPPVNTAVKTVHKYYDRGLGCEIQFFIFLIIWIGIYFSLLMCYSFIKVRGTLPTLFAAIWLDNTELLTERDVCRRGRGPI
jgi:hypothetical protein